MTSDIELHPDFAPAPTTLFASADPAIIVGRAARIAEVIAPLIRQQNLVKRIGQSEHVFLEGWTLAGTMLGVFPITVSSGPIIDPEGIEVGYEATVEARTMAGAIVGRADAQCTTDENAKWRDAPSFQLRSMAITRASSKALRMPLGFVMKLAGYETTPAEEMEAAAARGESVSGGRGVAHGWRDKLEQDRAHQRLHEFVTTNGLTDELAAYLASKGYETPLAKGQWNQAQKAMVRELQERGQQTAGPDPHSPPRATGPAPNASATGSGDTDASAGQEPPDAEAPTSPTSPGDDKAGRGRKAGRVAPERDTSDLPPAEPTQAAPDGPEPPGWEP